MGDLVHKTKVVPFLNIGKDGVVKWMQLKKSTSFTLALNPQTKTFDFISDETPTEEIDSYQPSLSQSLTMLKGEADYEHIFNMLYTLPTGKDAHRAALIVFYKEEGTTGEKRIVKRIKKVEEYEKTADTTIDSAKMYFVKSGEEFAVVDEAEESALSKYFEKKIKNVEYSETQAVKVFKAWKLDALVKVNQMDTVNETIDFDLSFSDRKEGAVEVVDGEPVFSEGKWKDGIFEAKAV